LHILQWAREHGCAWNWQTCKAAFEEGHVELLKWAIVSGCSMDHDDDDDEDRFNLCESAADRGHWDIVKLAWDHGCSCSDSIKHRYSQYQLQHQSTQHQQQLRDTQSQLEAVQYQVERLTF